MSPSSPSTARAPAASAAAGEADQALKFLLQWMPAHDKGSLPDGYLEDNVALALEARRSTSWAAAVPLDIFNNYVLPYASLSVRHPASQGREARDFCDLWTAILSRRRSGRSGGGF